MWPMWLVTYGDQFSVYLQVTCASCNYSWCEVDEDLSL